MFDIGFSELLVIAIVALVVLGPERLPKAARFAGLWVRRARAQWYSVKAELERDLAAEELRRGMDDARDAMRGIDDSVRASEDEIRREFEALRASTQRDRDALADGLMRPAEAPSDATAADALPATDAPRAPDPDPAASTLDHASRRDARPGRDP